VSVVQNTMPPVPRGTPGERARARLGAAVMVRRAGGDAAGLRLVLSALDLWPAQDPAEVITFV
jgi:hypothetical protein